MIHDVHARVVEVLRAGGGRGSGFAVAADLVLTAAHVVADDPVVRVVAGDEELSGTVVWCHPALDAALVRLPDRRWRGIVTRWATLSGVRPMPCTAIGYPRAQNTGDGTRAEEHIAGFIMPATAHRIGRYAINVTSALPYEPLRNGSPWSGMSGAAVLTGDGRHVLAVLTDDPTSFEASRLEAVPVAHLLADPAFSDLVGTGPAALATLTGGPGGDVDPPAFDAPALGRFEERARRATAESYLRWAINDWRYIDLGDLGLEQEGGDSPRVRRLPLQRMYISLQADLRTVDDRHRARLMRRLDQEDLDPGIARTVASFDAAELLPQADPEFVPRGDDDGIALEDAFNRHRILIVLGHPGSGKSVLCLWLGWTLARQALEALRAGAAPAVPMRFRAADYAQFYARDLSAGRGPGGIARFLAGTLATQVRRPEAHLRQFFDETLANGRGVLLIDGLDEVIDHRDQVADALAGEAERHAAAGSGRGHVVITSRVAGYDDVYLDLDGAAHYLIRPMSTGQTSRFVHNFFAEIEAGVQAPLLLDRLAHGNNAVRRLATTPLLLTSMCSYWHRHRALPASRARLYRQLLIDTAFRWRRFAASDESPDLDALLGDEAAFLGLLSRIAFAIHDEHVDGRMPEDELLETLDRALLGGRRLTGADARPLARQLVDRIREKIGVFAEVAPGQFGFIHQTFREYLAGLALLADVNRDGDTGRFFDALNELVGDPRWREPTLFALSECPAEQRAALMRTVREVPGVDIERWVEIFLALLVELPPDAVHRAELGTVLALYAGARDAVRDQPDTAADLDVRLADVRRHLGGLAFDTATVELLDRDEALTTPLAGAYWRRRWLTAPVLRAFAAVSHRDTAEEGWPIHRALRHALAPAPLREAGLRDELERPADPADHRAMRLYEFGRVAWERARTLLAETQIAGDAVALPVRQLLAGQPDVWRACLADAGVLRVLATLFGGLDHHDTLAWIADSEQLGRLLLRPGARQAAELERRAASLVPRFGADDLTHTMAIELDTAGGLITSRSPSPVIAVEWMTRPAAPGVERAVLDWLRRTPGDSGALRRRLTVLVDGAADAADSAEAELGLLVLDGRPMNRDHRSLDLLARAEHLLGDALLRAHRDLLAEVWRNDRLSPAERAAMHRFLLRILFQVTSRPVALWLPDSGDVEPDRGFGHPVLAADGLAHSIFAPWWGSPSVNAYPHAALSPERLLAALSWLTTLPYVRGVVPALWDGSEHTAPARTVVEPVLAGLVAWVYRRIPASEADLAALVQAAVAAAAADGEPARAASAVDAAYAMAAAATVAGDRERRNRLLHHALDRLEVSEEADRQAEALYRIRWYTGDDPDLAERLDTLGAAVESPFLRAQALDDQTGAAVAMIEALGPALPIPAQVALLATVRVLAERARLVAAVAADSPTVDGGRDSYAGVGEPLQLVLNADVLAAITQHMAQKPDDHETVMDWLSIVSGVDDTAADGLRALLDGADPALDWVAAGRDLLTLRRIAADPTDGAGYLELADMMRRGDTATVARAQLELLGPWRGADRLERRRQLSRTGVSAWWQLGEAALHDGAITRRNLLLDALTDWDIDDAAQVHLACERSAESAEAERVWRVLLESATLWRPDCQLALASWIAHSWPGPGLAGAYLDLLSMLATAGHGVPVRPELIDAVLTACRERAVTGRMIPTLSGKEWRLEVARIVCEVCLRVLQNPAGDTGIAAVRAAFAGATAPVVAADDPADAMTRLEKLGNLQWIGLTQRPWDAAAFVPEEMSSEDAVTLLRDWLLDLDVNGAFDTHDPLDHAVAEAVLNVLVVASGRNRAAFRLACPPELMQPLLSRAITGGRRHMLEAAFSLLGRLRFVDLHPAHGIDLVQVLDIALHRADTAGEAFAFLGDIRHVRGGSLSDAVLDRLTRSNNECVVHGFAGLAAAYLASPTCPAGDRRRIRRVLRTEGGRHPTRRTVLLVGNGVDDDPVTAVVGQDRQTEFRRLLRLN